MNVFSGVCSGRFGITAAAARCKNDVILSGTGWFVVDQLCPRYW